MRSCIYIKSSWKARHCKSELGIGPLCLYAYCWVYYLKDEETQVVVVVVVLAQYIKSAHWKSRRAKQCMGEWVGL